MRRGERTHDPWWDDKLFPHVIFPGRRTADLPSQYCQHPSPGKKTYHGGTWTTVGPGGEVGIPVDRVPNRFYSCDNYPGYSGPTKREARGRRQLQDRQPDDLPEPERNVTQDTNDIKNGDDVNLVPRKIASGGFLSPDAYAYFGCMDFDGDDPCSWDPTCGAPGDFEQDDPDQPLPTGFVGSKKKRALGFGGGGAHRYNRGVGHGHVRKGKQNEED